MGKKLKIIRKKRESNSLKPWLEAKRQQAASIEREKLPNQLPDKKNVHSLHSLAKSKKPRRQVKSIIMAIITAMVIGVGIGLWMIYIFAHHDDGQIRQAEKATTPMTEHDVTGQATSITIKPIHAFVLQAGVFSSVGNAKDWAAKYMSTDLTMVWERDGQYFLLAGLAETEQQAKRQADGMSVDIYVKEWSTGKLTNKYHTNDKNWLQLFTKTWKQSLGDGADTSKWKDFLQHDPPKDKALQDLYSLIKTNSEKMETGDKNKRQILLLQEWKQYETDLLQGN